MAIFHSVAKAFQLALVIGLFGFNVRGFSVVPFGGRERFSRLQLPVADAGTSKSAVVREPELIVFAAGNVSDRVGKKRSRNRRTGHSTTRAAIAPVRIAPPVTVMAHNSQAIGVVPIHSSTRPPISRSSTPMAVTCQRYIAYEKVPIHATALATGPAITRNGPKSAA